MNGGNEPEVIIMSFKLSYFDLERLIKSYGYDDHTATVVADYLDECIDFELDLTYYIWNTLPYFVQCFKTKEEAEEYVKSELGDLSPDNYRIYECENYKGVYLEWT